MLERTVTQLNPFAQSKQSVNDSDDIELSVVQCYHSVEAEMAYNELGLFRTLSQHCAGRSIMAKLSLSDLGHLAMLNHTYAGLHNKNEFKFCLDQLCKSQLSLYLSKADWDRAKPLIKHNPQLMFECFLKKRLPWQAVTFESPLQFAVRVADNHSLKIFNSLITNLGDFESYWKSLEAIEQFDFDVFFDTYRNYLDGHGDARLCIQTLGTAQAELLPFWVLVEQCATSKNLKKCGDGRSWNIHTDFSKRERPTGDITINFENEKVDLRSLGFYKRLGKNFYLHRSARWETVTYHESEKDVNWSYQQDEWVNDPQATAANIHIQSIHAPSQLPIYEKLIEDRKIQQVIILNKMRARHEKIITQVSKLQNDQVRLEQKRSDGSFTTRFFKDAIERKLEVTQVKLEALQGKPKVK